MVVHDVVVLVPDVVVAVEDGHGVHVLVAWVRLLYESVPDVGDGAEEEVGLHMGVDPVEQAEGGAPGPQQGRDAVVDRHAAQELAHEAPLLALDEQRCWADADPVEGEAGNVHEERAKPGAVHVQVCVHVINVVVPAVVDLHVRDGVVHGNNPVERRDPPFDDAVHVTQGPLEEPPMVVACLMNERMCVGEELETRAKAQDVVDEEGGELEAVQIVAPHGPEEQSRGDDAQKGDPRDVRVIPGVLHQQAAQGPGHRTHKFRDLLPQRGAHGVQPQVLQHNHH
mmetsp:Transcript_63579/g.197307  ORF Transcript_63579/g.197307 Transcript_63579/m.197307 type:complete len:282 (-) Transcript_63579:270-1115(-)